jgi:hypothetical protein
VRDDSTRQEQPQQSHGSAVPQHLFANLPIMSFQASEKQLQSAAAAASASEV